MNLKAKIAMGMVSSALGATAIMGGTFAYFSSTSTSSNQFQAGTLKMAPSSQYIEQFQLTNFKPGDLLDATKPNVEPAMTLNNQGTLPFHVLMKVTSNETDGKGLDSTLVFKSLGFGGQDVLSAVDTLEGLPAGTPVTLKQLADASTKNSITVNAGAPGGTTSSTWTGINLGDLLPAPADRSTGGFPDIKSFTYQIAFPDNGQDQNNLQGANAPFAIEFEAVQFDGKTYDNTNLSNGSGGTSGGGTFKSTSSY